ncbi:MAG: hypothetical protein N3B21_06565 [Clostridia bacterium]|nr:hypothetical protein [Clostridia bacterium]
MAELTKTRRCLQNGQIITLGGDTAGQDKLPLQAFNEKGERNYYSLSADSVLPGPKPNQSYQFLFWNINGSIIKTPMIVNQPVPEYNFTATAWYYLVGEGQSQPHITTYAFSADEDKVLESTPIEKVIPDNDQVWPNKGSVVYTSSSSVKIDPLDKKGISDMRIKGKGNIHVIYGFLFKSWELLWNSGCSINGSILEGQQNAQGLAIAVYQQDVLGTIRIPILRGREFKWDIVAANKAVQVALDRIIQTRNPAISAIKLNHIKAMNDIQLEELKTRLPRLEAIEKDIPNIIK